MQDSKSSIWKQSGLAHKLQGYGAQAKKGNFFCGQCGSESQIRGTGSHRFAVPVTDEAGAVLWCSTTRATTPKSTDSWGNQGWTCRKGWGTYRSRGLDDPYRSLPTQHILFSASQGE